VNFIMPTPPETRTLADPKRTITFPSKDGEYVEPPSIAGYELIAVLGQGGMGIVWQARHLALNRLVALKMIIAESQHRERFDREAQAVAKLQHPNIVQIYEVGECDGRPFLSLEFVEGGTLAHKLDRKPLPPREAAGLLKTLAETIEAAHRQGIIHRDLKPANVLLTRDGQPKIADFGLARDLVQESSQTQTGQILGTPSYMAPEQALGIPSMIGPPTDVYALGAILYEMLTGQPPFIAPTVIETLDLVRSQEPVPPRRLQPKIPRDLATICLKCLEKRPQQRYASAQLLADDLSRFLDGKPVHARPVSTITRIARLARRRPAISMLLFVLVFVTAAGVIVGLNQYRTIQIANEGLEKEQQAKERQLQETRRALYLSRFVQAVNHTREFRIGDARLILAQCEPDVRGWEWHILNQQINDTPTLWIADKAIALAVSPDGHLLAGTDGAGVAAWETSSGKRLWRYEFGRSGYEFGVNVVFPPDGKRILTASSFERDGEPNLGSLVALDPLTGEPTKIADPGLRVAISPDGKLIAYWGKGIRVLDAATGKEIRQIKDEGSVAFTPDGKLAVLGEKLRFYHPITGELLQPLFDLGFPSPCNEVVISPDGRWAAMMRVESGTGAIDLQLWEIRNLKQCVLHIDAVGVNSDHHIYSVVFSPDSQWLVFGGHNGYLQFWRTDEVESRSTLRLDRHRGPISGLAFSGDGRWLYSSGDDGTIRVTDFAEPEFKSGMASGDTVGPTGLPLKVIENRIAEDGGETLVTFAEPLSKKPNQFNDLLMASPSGKEIMRCRLVNNDGGLDRVAAIIDVETGAERCRLVGHSASIKAAAFSPDGTRIATVSDHGRHRFWDKVSDDHTVRIWDALTGQELLRFPHPGAEFQGPQFHEIRIGFSPDGRHLAFASGDTVRLWTASESLADRKVLLDGRAKDWHLREARERIENHSNFGAKFHLRFCEGPEAKELRAKLDALPK